MKKRISAVLLTASLCAPAFAAQDIIALKVNIKDQDGLTVKGLEGQIELLTLSGGITNSLSNGSLGGGSGAGKSQATPYQLVKHVDAASPALLAAVATGKVFPTAVISFNRNGNEAGLQQYFEIQFSDVRFSAQNLSGSEGHAARDTEMLTLVYSKVCLVYRPQLATGALGNEIENCFNFSTASVE